MTCLLPWPRAEGGRFEILYTETEGGVAIGAVAGDQPLPDCCVRWLLE
jgi:hypothetical protein